MKPFTKLPYSSKYTNLIWTVSRYVRILSLLPIIKSTLPTVRSLAVLPLVENLVAAQCASQSASANRSKIFTLHPI